ncbi:MAG: hypothetical protein HKL95_08545 [Phycisphaerae bacterium]|nr:hypothetical protein [Phycisphaerae bacterium]
MVIAEIADGQVRATLFGQLIGDEMLQTLKDGGKAAAGQLFRRYLAAAKFQRPGAGEKTSAPD